MEIQAIGQLIVIVLSILVTVAGGVGVIVYQIKRSGRQERKDVTETADLISDFWKNQAEKLEQILKVKDEEFNQKLITVTKDFNNKIQELTRQVGELTGQLNAEKVLNERFEKIFQNRSPEMEQFMKYMVDATEKHSETHEAMMRVLTDLHATSANNHEILDSRKKEVKIEGTITRKPLKK